MEENSQPEVGVGPWPGGPEKWPAEEVYDPQLLAEGDRRNVEDRYRYWKMEAIIADIADHALPFEIAIENLGHDFNIGSIVRSANALGVSRVHIVGRRRWNRRGAMVTDRYLEVIHHPEVGEFISSLHERGITPVFPLKGMLFPNGRVWSSVKNPADSAKKCAGNATKSSTLRSADQRVQ